MSSASILASGTESRMREEQGKRDKRSKKRQTPINKQPSVTSQPSVKRQKKQPDESTKENSPQSLKVHVCQNLQMTFNIRAAWRKNLSLEFPNS